MLREIVEGVEDSVKSATAFFKKIGIYGENVSVSKSDSKFIKGEIEFFSNSEAKECKSIIYAEDNEGVVDDFDISGNVLKFTLDASKL